MTQAMKGLAILGLMCGLIVVAQPAEAGGGGDAIKIISGVLKLEKNSQSFKRVRDGFLMFFKEGEVRGHFHFVKEAGEYRLVKVTRDSGPGGSFQVTKSMSLEHVKSMIRELFKDWRSVASWVASLVSWSYWEVQCTGSGQNQTCIQPI